MTRYALALVCALVTLLPAQLRADTLSCGTLDGLIESGPGGVATADIDLGGAYLLILDVDADTTISAAVDDSIVLTTGGVARLSVGPTLISAGLDFYLNGNDLFLDADSDSSISAAVDDNIAITAGGVLKATFGAHLTMASQLRLNNQLMAFDSGVTTYLQQGGANVVSFVSNAVIEAQLQAGYFEITNALKLGDATTPACEAAHGCLWVESDGTLHFRHGTSGDETIGGTLDTKAFHTSTGGTGTHWLGGYYTAPAASVTLTQASTTATHGTANVAYAAHAFYVAGAAGTCDTGCTTCRLDVEGTSITDAGVRTAADTETILADVTTGALDQYGETPKKWLGQVTYRLVPDAGNCSFTFNRGYAKYDDHWNRDFSLRAFGCVGQGGANDAGFDLEVLHHATTGWTYHASAFAPGGTVLAQLSTDYSTERELVSNIPFAYKRDDLNTSIAGATDEGFVFRMTTTANNAVERMTCRVGVILE
jgi:hypothetical protein